MYILSAYPVPSKDMLTPPPSFRIAPIFMNDSHSAESNEKSIFQLYFEVYGWLYLQITKNLPTKKKVVLKWSNLQERCALLWKLIFSSWVFYVRLLVFDICSILYIVDFYVCDLSKSSHIGFMWCIYFCFWCIQMLTNEVMVLNPKACGVKGHSPSGVCGGRSSLINFFKPIKWFSPKKFESVHIYMKDAECTEIIKKSILQFLVSWYGRFTTQNQYIFRWILSTKLTITQQIKIAKIRKITWNSFQMIAHLFCKLDPVLINIFFVGDTLENPGVSPVNCKYNQP